MFTCLPPGQQYCDSLLLWKLKGEVKAALCQGQHWMSVTPSCLPVQLALNMPVERAVLPRREIQSEFVTCKILYALNRCLSKFNCGKSNKPWICCRSIVNFRPGCVTVTGALVFVFLRLASGSFVTSRLAPRIIHHRAQSCPLLVNSPLSNIAVI
jgi:hypothetical protein